MVCLRRLVGGIVLLVFAKAIVSPNEEAFVQVHRLGRPSTNDLVRLIPPFTHDVYLCQVYGRQLKSFAGRCRLPSARSSTAWLSATTCIASRTFLTRGAQAKHRSYAAHPIYVDTPELMPVSVDPE